MLTPQHTQEGLHLAYIEAVAATAGCNVAAKRGHDYGVDGTFHSVITRNGRRFESGYALGFQAKATTDWASADDHVVYDLDVKNHNDLVSIANSEGATPHVLIVFCQPAEPTDWMRVDDEVLTLKKCCYWAHLTGELSNNRSTVRIRLPLANRFDPAALTRLLAAVRTGELRCGQ